MRARFAPSRARRSLGRLTGCGGRCSIIAAYANHALPPRAGQGAARLFSGLVVAVRPAPQGVLWPAAAPCRRLPRRSASRRDYPPGVGKHSRAVGGAAFPDHQHRARVRHAPPERFGNRLWRSVRQGAHQACLFGKARRPLVLQDLDLLAGLFQPAISFDFLD
jgi:hypothetical protein